MCSCFPRFQSHHRFFFCVTQSQLYSPFEHFPCSLFLLLSHSIYGSSIIFVAFCLRTPESSVCIKKRKEMWPDLRKFQNKQSNLNDGNIEYILEHRLEAERLTLLKLFSTTEMHSTKSQCASSSALKSHTFPRRRCIGMRVCAASILHWVQQEPIKLIFTLTTLCSSQRQHKMKNKIKLNREAKKLKLF